MEQNELIAYLRRNHKYHTEFRLVILANDDAYIHVMNRDSETLNFKPFALDFEEANRRGKYEINPEWTEKEYEWASALIKQIRYDGNLATAGKKMAVEHLRKCIAGESLSPTESGDPKLGPLLAQLRGALSPFFNLVEIIKAGGAFPNEVSQYVPTYDQMQKVKSLLSMLEVPTEKPSREEDILPMSELWTTQQQANTVAIELDKQVRRMEELAEKLREISRVVDKPEPLSDDKTTTL